MGNFCQRCGSKMENPAEQYCPSCRGVQPQAPVTPNAYNAYNQYNAGVPYANPSYSSGGIFSKIGGKIKMLAQILTWIGIAVSVIAGLIMMSEDEDLIGGALVIMIVGSLVSWISSFLLYGFGQLVDNSDKILEELKRK